MEANEITTEKLVAWAEDYASYEDLERAAKALYGMYVQRRKIENPKAHSANKRAKQKHVRKLQR
jgi:hypothetical protein